MYLNYKKGAKLKYLFLFLLTSIQFSCGTQEKTKPITDYVSFPNQRREELVNQSSLSISTDHSKATSFVETEYGLLLSMFSDGKFYYRITGLGEGVGFWKYEKKGYFHLHANYSRSPNGLNFFIIALDKTGSKIDVVFDDRFGVQRKRVEITNEVKRRDEV